MLIFIRGPPTYTKKAIRHGHSLYLECHTRPGLFRSRSQSPLEKETEDILIKTTNLRIIRIVANQHTFPLYHIILSFSALLMLFQHILQDSVSSPKILHQHLFHFHAMSGLGFFFCFCLFICCMILSLIPSIQNNISIATFSVSSSRDTDECVQVSIVLFLPWHGKQCTLDRVTWKADTSQAQEI